MKKEIPILYSTQMIQAINVNTKTQTRRTKGLEKFNKNPNSWSIKHRGEDLWSAGNIISSVWELEFKCPYGQIGDLLWVRETSCYVMLDHAHDLLEGQREFTQYVYKASIHSDWMEYAKEKYGYKWKPSIHMPKVADSFWLEITNITIERLNHIKKDDAIAEGIYRNINNGVYKLYTEKTLSHIMAGVDDARVSFMSLWISIYGKESWSQNPFVWVITFKKVAKP